MSDPTPDLAQIQKETAEALAQLNEEFKRRDEEYKKHGEMLGDTEAKFDQLNDKLADLAKLQDRLEVLETRANTPDTATTSDEKTEAVSKAFSNYLRKGDMESPEIKGLVAADDASGGYLLAPPEFVADIIKPIDEYSPIRSIAQVRSTSRSSVNIPKRTGTFTAQWIAESATRSETTGLTTGLEEIGTHEMYAEVPISWQELEDSAFNLEAFLAEEFGTQFATAEATAATTGNGVGKPEGFVTKAVADSSITNLGHASAINSLDGLIDLQHAVKTGHAAQSVWTMRRATIGILRKAKGGDGQYLWEPSSQSADPMNFMGNRIVEFPDMAAVAANAYAVGFGNFRRGYLLVDRIQIQILRDPYSSKASGAVDFLARKRVGGQTILSEAIRLGKVAA